MKILLKVAAFWAVATLSNAQGAPAVDAAAPPAPASGDAKQETVAVETAAPATARPVVLPDERRWRLGAAVGYGERTNPLIQSDDIPVLVDLDVAYFGD